VLTIHTVDLVHGNTLYIPKILVKQILTNHKLVLTALCNCRQIDWQNIV